MLGATFYRTESVDRVYQPTFSLDLNDFNGNVIENPTAAQTAAICNQSRVLGGTVAECEQTPVSLIIDDRLQSLERLTTSGVDVSVRYLTDAWRIRLEGAYLLSYRGMASDGAVVEELNALNNPVALRVRATLARTFGAITLSAAASYTGGYDDAVSAPPRRVGSWATVDLGMRYKPSDASMLRGVELQFGVRNLMNRQPPFVNNGTFGAGWDPENGGNLEGRTISGQVLWSR